MSKLMVGIFFLSLSVLVLAQGPLGSPQYQPATIIQVKLHQNASSSDQGQKVYEVSIKVNGTTYVVLTAAPSGESTMLYVVGREVLVQVGDNSILWNDILGQSHEVPIIAKGPIIASTYSHN